MVSVTPWLRVSTAVVLCAVPVLPVSGAESALRIEGVSGRDNVPKPATILNMAALAAMPRSAARVRGHDGAERNYEGVALAEILKRAGLPQGDQLRGGLLGRYLLFTAHDGYHVVFSLPELDPAFTGAAALLADHVDGQPLPPREGPLRLIIPGEKREARWIRMVERIDVLSAPEPLR